MIEVHAADEEMVNIRRRQSDRFELAVDAFVFSDDRGADLIHQDEKLLWPLMGIFCVPAAVDQNITVQMGLLSTPKQAESFFAFATQETSGFLCAAGSHDLPALPGVENIDFDFIHLRRSCPAVPWRRLLSSAVVPLSVVPMRPFPGKAIVVLRAFSEYFYDVCVFHNPQMMR